MVDRRSYFWLSLNALLWLVVGSASTLAVELARARPHTLADAADAAAERMSELDLTTDQRARLDRIRDDWRAGILAEEHDYLDRLDRAAAAADGKVAELLTAEQARRYRELSLGRDAH